MRCCGSSGPVVARRAYDQWACCVSAGSETLRNECRRTHAEAGELGLTEMADLISVCVCTYRRPALLRKLLEKLDASCLNDPLTFEIVVVDNDAQRSAEATVRRFATQTSIPTTYDCEPIQSISLARNRAIRVSAGNLVAFIDDDEWPREDWLRQLHMIFKTHCADGVFGPVVADYPPDAPQWLRKGRFLERRRLPTGARISAGDARTGNVLLDRSLFSEEGPWFDPALGRTGGEDSDFFYRRSREGRLFVWCDRAVVYESVPPERWRATFHLRRLLRSGVLQGEWMRAGRIRSGRPSARRTLARNAAILLACALLSLPAFILPRHLGMRIWQKGAYCGGLIAAYFGCSILRYRE